MTGIDPANQLAALIRVQVASLRRDQKLKTSGGKRRTSAAPIAPTPDLAMLVAQRIRSIPTDDPDRERKAFRVFLECVLLSELGQELISDPAFTVMVDHVQEQMQGDPQLAQASVDAARLLLESAQRPR